MRLLNVSLFAAFLTGLTNLAAADASQICYEMYPQDSYRMEDRHLLIKDCLKAYEQDTGEQDTANQDSYSQPGDPAVEEPAYYDGSVEDYVNELPAETPAE